MTTECQRDDRDGHADEGTIQSPHVGPEKRREQDQKWRDRKYGTSKSGLNIAADDKLDNIQADEDADDRLPGVHLRHFE